MLYMETDKYTLEYISFLPETYNHILLYHNNYMWDNNQIQQYKYNEKSSKKQTYKRICSFW